ncbi:hypothetical protein, partial [Staphylococcus aureus]
MIVSKRDNKVKSFSTMLATSIILTNILPYDSQAASEKDTEISTEILS